MHTVGNTIAVQKPWTDGGGADAHNLYIIQRYIIYVYVYIYVKYNGTRPTRRAEVAAIWPRADRRWRGGGGGGMVDAHPPHLGARVSFVRVFFFFHHDRRRR